MGQKTNILLVGCGNMGQALVRGWLAKDWPVSGIRAVEPDAETRAAAQSLGIAVTAARDSVEADVVVLAAKPQQLDRILPEYADLVKRGSTFLTIAAGKPIAFYEALLGAGAAVVRAMPNTPAAIGQGMTVLVANSGVDEPGRETCESLMAAVGQVAWLEDEGLMDAVTAVSGSGPAYVFLLIECLTEAAIQVGLSGALADQLARTTVAGAGAYALSSELDAGELRRRVTSPGGTTEAALGVLAGNDELLGLMKRAVQAATERSRELA